MGGYYFVFIILEKEGAHTISHAMNKPDYNFIDA